MWMILQLYLLYVGGQLGVFVLLLLIGLGFLLVSVHLEMQHHKGEVHLHFFQLCGILVAFTAIPNVLSAVVQGFLIGVYIESVTRLRITGCYEA
jgi:hypothetical protein